MYDFSTNMDFTGLNFLLNLPVELLCLDTVTDCGGRIQQGRTEVAKTGEPSPLFAIMAHWKRACQPTMRIGRRERQPNYCRATKQKSAKNARPAISYVMAGTSGEHDSNSLFVWEESHGEDSTDNIPKTVLNNRRGAD
jgi:hypothetical protein